MVIAKVLFSSESGEHTTPKDLFDRCNARWGPFDLDAAATEKNSLCPTHFSNSQYPDVNGLTARWRARRIWCNPPYGHGIGAWVKKAAEATEKGDTERVVMLLPARTDTHWWQTFVTTANEIHFLKGRLKFSGAKNSAPFPSAIVVFESPFE